MEIHISITYEWCLACQLNAKDRVKEETAAKVLRYRKKKIVNIFFRKIPSKISLRINWKYLLRDERQIRTYAFNECFYQLSKGTLTSPLALFFCYLLHIATG